MTDKPAPILTDLSNRQLIMVASGLWGALQTALSIHSRIAGKEAAIEITDALIQDAKRIDFHEVGIEEEFDAMKVLLRFIETAGPSR